jgi:hypothetical protein
MSQLTFASEHHPRAGYTRRPGQRPWPTWDVVARGSACKIEVALPALVEQYRHGRPRLAGGERLLTARARTHRCSRATRPAFSLGDAGPRAVSVGPTIHAGSAKRFCHLRAMHQPELHADEPRFIFWTVRAGSATRGPDMRKARGGAGEGEGRATSTGKVEKWVACRAR